VDLDAAFLGTHKALDNDLILIALVLNKKSVLGFVNEAGDTVASIPVAPNKQRVFGASEGATMPVVFETLDDFGNFVGMVSDNGIITGTGEIFDVPVEDWTKAS